MHLLYVGHSTGAFELQRGLSWPDGSWALSSFLSTHSARSIATALYVVSAVGFLVAGAVVLSGQPWWRWVLAASAAFASMAVVVLWDATTGRLADQGAIGLLINAALLVAVLVVRWPRLGL